MYIEKVNFIKGLEYKKRHRLSQLGDSRVFQSWKVKTLTKKIVFTGGGSAGHVSVNTAIIPEFIKNNWEVTYIGSEKGIEKTIIEKEFPNISYKTVSVGKLRRYVSIENMKDPFRVIKGIFDARRILKQTRPDFIFSKVDLCLYL